MANWIKSAVDLYNAVGASVFCGFFLATLGYVVLRTATSMTDTSPTLVDALVIIAIVFLGVGGWPLILIAIGVKKLKRN